MIGAKGLGLLWLSSRLGVISERDISTLQYFIFALKSKANTKMLHQRVLNHPLMASKVWGQASTILQGGINK